MFLVCAATACGGAAKSPGESDAGDRESDASLEPVDASRAIPDAASPPADAARDERTTVLAVHYPAGAHRVFVRGSGGGLDWSRGLEATSLPDDIWELRLDGVTERIEWKPLLDDTTWSRGPNYVAQPTARHDVYPHFTATHGEVTTLVAAFHSAALPAHDRAIRAYLPPTYLENTRAQLPVLYMQDGQNLFDPALAFGGNEWRIDEAIDAAAEDGSFPEVVVIGVDNTAARIDEYTPTDDADLGAGGELATYLAMLRDEVVPLVRARLRVADGPEHTFIGGSSLGGLVAVYAGLRMPTTFGGVCAMSPSSWWDGEQPVRDVASEASHLPRALRVYVDSGDSGEDMDDVEATRRLAVAYRMAGYRDEVDFRHVVEAGGTHDERSWARRFPQALRFLLGPGR